MHLPVSDWKWASILAVSLLGMAFFVVFVINPGGRAGCLALSFASRLISRVRAVGSRLPASIKRGISCREGADVGFNFAGYWLISYAVIKIFRAGGRQLGSPEF
jgi:hypothetical protein